MGALGVLTTSSANSRASAKRELTSVDTRKHWSCSSASPRGVSCVLRTRRASRTHRHASPSPRIGTTPARTSEQMMADEASTEAILTELGYDQGAIAAMRAAGAVC